MGQQLSLQALDSLIQQAASQRNLTLLRRRKFAMEALMSATDLSTIYAAMAIVKDLHQGCSSELHPMAAQLVSEAQRAGQMLLTQSLANRFTSPRCFGGLAYSDTKAHILIQHINQTIGPHLVGTMIITVEKLVALGLPWGDSMEITPYLRLIVDEIRRKFYSLTEMLLTITANQSLMNSQSTMSPRIVYSGM
jgi:hypothetical protein